MRLKIKAKKIKNKESFRGECYKEVFQGKQKENSNSERVRQFQKMKIPNEDIQQLLFFKKLSQSNRLNEIIHSDQEPYPPPLYTANEIYSSQYATALQTIKEEGLIHTAYPKQEVQTQASQEEKKPRASTKRKARHPTHHPSIKYPLPLAFAYFQAYENQKYHEKAVNVLKNHLERKNGVDQHVIYYNLSCLYREMHDSKKAIFYLETVLKEKPFFEQAIIDYAFLLSMTNRGTEALEYLRRHLSSNSANSHPRTSLSESSQIQSMFLSLAYQTKSLTEKQVLKLFANRSLSLQTIFNLGLYFKKIKSFAKAEQIFNLLIEKYDACYDECKKEGSQKGWMEKDQKVYFFAKLNLSELYENWAKEQSFDKENPQYEKQDSKAFKCKALSILEALIKNQEEAMSKYPLFYLKYIESINEKLVKLSKEINSQASNSLFQLNDTLSKSVKIVGSKADPNSSQLKNITSVRKYPNLFNAHSSTSFNNTQRLDKLSKNIPTERSELDLMKEFNRKFQQKRLENEKKLKFLLLKDKELDNFFNALPKINFEKHDKSILIGDQEHSTITHQNQSILTKDMNASLLKTSMQPPNYPQNQTLIKRLRKELQDENVLASLEEQFENKKLKYEQEFEGYNLDEALEKIMNKIFGDSGKEQTQDNDKSMQSSIKNEQKFRKNSCVKVGENQTQISFRAVKNTQPRESLQDRDFSRRSKEKQLTIDQNIDQINNAKNRTYRENPGKTHFAKKESQTKKGFDYKRINVLSQRKGKRQVSTSGNFRIKNPLAKNLTGTKQKQVRKSLHEQHESKSNNNSNFQKTLTLNKKQRNSPQFKESIKDSPKDIVYDIKELLKESAQNTQKLIETSKIFVQKDKNNIEDIFQAFNPKTNRNILINKSVPSTKRLSQRIPVDGSLSLFGLRMNDQASEEEKKIPSEYSKKYEQASRLQNEGHYEEAFDMYTELYKEFKDENLKQMTLLGIAYNFELQKDYDQAQKTYLKCCKYNNAETFMRLGQLLIRRNRIEEGIENLQKANCIKRYDKEIETKLVYGYSLKEETIDKALSLAHLVLKRDPTSLEILIMTANILQKQGKIKEALEICLAIDQHRESEFIKHYIGTLYLTDGNVVEAFKYFKSALQIKSNHVPSLIEIGTILSELKPKEAISILNKVLQIQPKNRLALARLAKIYESIEDNPERAMEIYRKTLETKSNYEAYMKIGNCLEANGSYVQALVNYRQALNLKKTHNAYMKIAEMHEFKKEYKRSIENYQLALQIIPKEHKFYDEKKKIMISMAKNMLILQEFDNAISTLEALLESEESKQIYSLLGQGYFGKQEYSIALEFYEKANSIEEKDDIEILEKLALCFDKKEEFTASKKIYQKILEIDPHNIKCINNYANVLLIIGNTNQAFYWYEVMLQHCPKNVEKRIKVADIYSAVGDWSKVEYHLLICYKQREHDIKVLQKLINLYKEKREQKMVAKFEKKLAMLKVNNKKKEH